MKNKLVLILIALGLLALVIGGIFIIKNNNLNNKIEILDATFYCGEDSPSEVFYENSEYIYSFPCPMSNSVYVKYSNGNKELVVALEEGKVTIDELIKAGLKIDEPVKK